MTNPLIRFIGLEIDNIDLPNPSFSMKYGEIEKVREMFDDVSPRTYDKYECISCYEIKEESDIKKAEELISALIQLIKAQKEESGL